MIFSLQAYLYLSMWFLFINNRHLFLLLCSTVINIHAVEVTKCYHYYYVVFYPPWKDVKDYAKYKVTEKTIILPKKHRDYSVHFP